MQGKLFQKCTVSLSLGGNVNTRRMSKPWHGINLSHKKSMKYSGHMKLLCELWKLSKFNARYPRILNEHWGIFSCLQIPPRENWFQYVRRVYATAITSLALHSCLYPHLRLHVLGCIVSRVLIYSVLMKKETIAKNCKPHWLEYKLNQPLFLARKNIYFIYDLQTEIR